MTVALLIAAGAPVSQSPAGDSISARWAAGIARVEVRHDRSDRKRAYLRLDIAEAKKLRDDLTSVLLEREPDA